MERRVRAVTAHIPPNLVYSALLLIVMPVVGTAGYMVLEGWSFLDALYMTVIVVTTIGFGEVRELDTSGRIFTMVFALAGFGAIFYALLSLFQFILEGELGTFLGVQRMKGQIAQLRDHFILCGFGRVGEEIAREFVARDLDFVVVENNPEAIERCQKRGYLLLVGDATIDSVQREAGVERARCLLAASDSDAGNTFIVLTAKALKPDLFIVSRAAHPESESRMLRAGADRVFSPYIIAGRQMAISAVQPMLVEFIDTLATGQETDEVLAELDVTPASGLDGQTLADVLRGSRRVVVLGVHGRGHDLDVGPPLTRALREGDRVILMGPESELEAIQPAARHVKARRRAG